MILFVEEVVNYHITVFIAEVLKATNEEVLLAAGQLDNPRRKGMSFAALNEPWIFTINSDKEKFERHFYEADVVVCRMSKYFHLMQKRLEHNKITFYASERWFKPPFGKFRLVHPRKAKLVFQLKKLSSFPLFYYLAQGHYAARDFNFLHICTGRIFNFGYFSPSETSSIEHNSFFLPNKIHIFWCGHMVGLKRVDTLLKAFALILKQKKEAQLILVGEGEQKKKIIRLGATLAISDHITILNFQPLDKIKKIMWGSDIYVLPSSGHEGWGTVVNEAMTESCVVIGSNMAGSVRTMIEDGVNGFVFKPGNYRQLAEKLLYLIDNREILEKFKHYSREWIVHNWSPELAAERFLRIVEQIQQGSPVTIYHEGLMKVL
ncbi:MAG: glycosyltransferase family 4 protein [Treponema sp.]|nr:glycosyltransferase family 4 protein [Treponema sp.]